MAALSAFGQANEVGKLDGVWEHEDGSVVITIDGETGVFTEIISGGWKTMLERERVKIGDVKFAGLKKTGDLTWTCTETAFNATSFRLITGPSTLTLSADGQTLKTSGSMVGIGTYTRTYRKR